MPDEKLARAIGSKIRRNILKILTKNKQISVHAFAEKYNLSESCASKHFKLLYDLGFLESEDKAPEKFYSLKIREIKGFIVEYDKIVKKMTRM